MSTKLWAPMKTHCHPWVRVNTTPYSKYPAFFFRVSCRPSNKKGGSYHEPGFPKHAPKKAGILSRGQRCAAGRAGQAQGEGWRGGPLKRASSDFFSGGFPARALLCLFGVCLKMGERLEWLCFFWFPSNTISEWIPPRHNSFDPQT